MALAADSYFYWVFLINRRGTLPHYNFRELFSLLNNLSSQHSLNCCCGSLRRGHKVRSEILTEWNRPRVQMPDLWKECWLKCETLHRLQQMHRWLRPPLQLAQQLHRQAELSVFCRTYTCIQRARCHANCHFLTAIRSVRFCNSDDRRWLNQGGRCFNVAGMAFVDYLPAHNDVPILEWVGCSKSFTIKVQRRLNK